MPKKHLDEKNQQLIKQREAEKKERQTQHVSPFQQMDAPAITHLQQTVGNSAVQALLAQRKGDGPTELDDETAAAIASEKGKGQSLDNKMATKAGGVMGQDFGEVKVHTDAQADTISRSIGAKAFTTGNDVFFREGEYKPHAADGQTLISHELTHVVQQGAGKATSSVQGKMTVNDPNDKFEAEADTVAQKVVQSKEADVQRQDEEEVQAQENEEELQTQEDEEEVQMQEEEEEVQAQEDEEEVQMQEDEEEVQMQEEEEEVQMKEEVQRQEEEEVV